MRAVPTRFFAAIVDDRVAAYCEVRQRRAHRTDRRRRGGSRVPRPWSRPRHRPARARRGAPRSRRRLPRGARRRLAAPSSTRSSASTLSTGVDFLTKFPHPLTRLRLRTPRLELRLATVIELRQLYQVAAAGIHDPGFMPFEIRLDGRPGRGGLPRLRTSRTLAAFSPETGELGLVAFHDGRPIGVQACWRSVRRRPDGGHRLLARRACQGRGLGTEMRAAVLTLAFDGLGGASARAPGAIAGQPTVARRLAQARVRGHRGRHGQPPRHPGQHTTTSSSRASASAHPCRSKSVGLDGVAAPLRRLVGSPANAESDKEEGMP